MLLGRLLAGLALERQLRPAAGCRCCRAATVVSWPICGQRQLAMLAVSATASAISSPPYC